MQRAACNTRSGVPLNEKFVPARLSLGQQVVEHLREKIFNIEIAPGTHLNAVEIASQLGVSRSPVRDALLMLSAEGLVEQDSGTGYQVIQFNEKLIDDVFIVRVALEPVALRQGIERFEADFINSQLDFWSNLQTTSVTSPQFREIYVSADNKLHETIVATSQNRLLSEILDKVIRLGMAIRHWQHKQIIVPEEISATSGEHVAIFEAIKSHQTEAAVEALTIHIENSKQRALSRFEDL
jgi:DNA-binding GntR family transcriptional regulator